MTGEGGQKPLTLASGSQVRAALMRGAGLEFDIAVSGVDEDAIKARHGGTPDALALKLAEAKARAIARKGLVVGADQILVCDGVLFDKPKDMDEARENLKKFRGRTHALVSGTVLLDDGKPVWSLAEQVTLTMRQFSDEFLEAYLLDVGDDVLKSVGCFGDWEITDFEGTGADARRVVRVTVRKKGADMLAHWWRSGVKGGPEVDPATFVDRSASKATEARRAWEQAQEMFRERVKNRQLIEVDAHDVTRDAGDA